MSNVVLGIFGAYQYLIIMTQSSSGCCPFSGNATDNNETIEATTSDLYSDLYNCFVQKTDDSVNPIAPFSITTHLHDLDFEKDTNDFIVIGGTEMLVYADQYAGDGEKLRTIAFRRSDVPSFVQLTSISHIVPTMAYLVEVIANPNIDSTKVYVTIDQFKKDLIALRDASEEDKFAWLDTATDVYQNRKQKIKDLIDFALVDSIKFLEDHHSTGYQFEMQDVIDYFYLQNVHDPSEPKSSLWKGVMVGTFELIVLDTIANLSVGNDENKAFLSSIRWDSLELLGAGQTGASSSGLTISTNSTYKVLYALSQYYSHLQNGNTSAHINVNNMIFAPYSAVSDWSSENLESLYTLFKIAYNNLLDRENISKSMFTVLRVDSTSQTNIPDAIASMYDDINALNLENKIQVPHPPIGNQESTTSEEERLDALTRRMAFTMIDYHDTLSDCVAAQVALNWTSNNYSTDIKLEGLGLDYASAV
ncbi:MAG: DUF5624 domain-containing protein [Flavobacteriales bacterium]|nr:DUF5624 domain-containing protein [Flavobacteriales bacterium]